VAELENDRDALVEYVSQLPIALDELSGEERNRVYRMLRLEVKPASESFEVTGAFCTSERMSWHPSETAKTCEIMFHALLIQDGARHLELVRT
jgi:hypothetical protein